MLIFLELILRKNNYHHILSFWPCSARGIVWSIDIYCCVGFLLHSSLKFTHVHCVPHFCGPCWIGSWRHLDEASAMNWAVNSCCRKNPSDCSAMNISHLIPSPYWIVIFHMLHLAMPKYAKCESKERSSSHLACEFYRSDMWKIRLRRFRGSSICDRPLQCMVNLARLNSQNLFNLPSGYLT